MYEAIPVVTSVTALIAVAVSVRLFRRQLDLTTDVSMDAIVTMVTAQYIERPALRTIFHEDEVQGEASTPTMDDRLRANALAESIADAMGRAVASTSKAHWSQTLQAWVEDSMRNSTFLRQWRRDHEHWYSTALIELLGRIEREIDEAAERDHQEVAERRR